MIGHVTLKGVGRLDVPEQIMVVSGLCLVFINITFNSMYLFDHLLSAKYDARCSENKRKWLISQGVYSLEGR